MEQTNKLGLKIIVSNYSSTTFTALGFIGKN